MFEWRAGVGDETHFQHSSLTRPRFVKSLPVAPGAMRCSAPERAEAVRPRIITYRRILDFVGDDRVAGRVGSPAAPFFDHTLLANLSHPKGGFRC